MEKPEGFADAIAEYIHSNSGKEFITTRELIDYAIERFSGSPCASGTGCRGRIGNWIKPVVKGLGYTSSVKYTGEGATGVGTVWKH